jgi:hypothetical protein
MNFEERMEARKLKESQEQSERLKEMSLDKYPVAIKFNILAKSAQDAAEALKMFTESMEGFSDISDVEALEV